MTLSRTAEESRGEPGATLAPNAGSRLDIAGRRDRAVTAAHCPVGTPLECVGTG